VIQAGQILIYTIMKINKDRERISRRSKTDLCVRRIDCDDELKTTVHVQHD